MRLTPSINELIFRKIDGDGNSVFNAIALYLGQSQQMLDNVIVANLENNGDRIAFKPGETKANRYFTSC